MLRFVLLSLDYLTRLLVQQTLALQLGRLIFGESAED